MTLMNLGMGGNFAPVRQASAEIDPNAFAGLDNGFWQNRMNTQIGVNQTYDRNDPNAIFVPWEELQRQATERQAALDVNQRNNQAYSSQLGGGFTGGLMANAPAYSQPFSGQITGFQNNAPSGGFGQMGFGQQPSMPMQQQAAGMGSPASAWGGAFTTKNPWSLG